MTVLDTGGGALGEEFCLTIKKRSGTEPLVAELRGRAVPNPKDSTGYFCRSDQYKVWLDNRGGPRTTLRAGSFSTSVPAGATAGVRVPAPSCAAEAPVTLNDERIGVLRVLTIDTVWNPDLEGVPATEA